MDLTGRKAISMIQGKSRQLNPKSCISGWLGPHLPQGKQASRAAFP